jgi:hypothetical protein
VFPEFATDVVDTGGKFAANVLDTDGKLPQVSLKPAPNFLRVSLTPVANFPPVSSKLAVLVANLLPALLIPWQICHRCS